MSILIFIIILLVLVLVHEAGHFFSAKMFGIRVDEFGFGFPPKIFGWKKGETEYSINALPFGGFVKIFGENIEEADLLEVGFLDKDSAKNDFSRSLVSKAKWKQAIVMIAGVFANFLLAWILFSFGFLSGLPTSVSAQPEGSVLKDVHLTIVSVSPKSPAEISGLKPGDKIISAQTEKDSLSLINPDSFKSFIVSHPNQEILISYIRGADNTILSAKMKPALSDSKPMIGISMDEIGTMKLPFYKAFWEGMKLNVLATKSTAVGLYTLIWEGIKGKGSFSEIAGPVGMVNMVGDVYKFGFSYLLSFAGLISVNLMIINLIPFPALDGGRLLFLLIEKIKGSRINQKVANTVNMVGFAILIILMLLVTYHDVVKLF